MAQRAALVLAVAIAVPAAPASAPARAAETAPGDAAPITVEVGIHSERHRGFFDSLGEDTGRSELEVEHVLRGRPWLETVAHDGEVLVAVTRRSVTESSRSKTKDGKVSVSWRYALRGSIRTRGDADVLEATTTSSETLSESDASRGRRETYSDRGTFDRLARELADKANVWILDHVEELRPNRPDAGFRHQAKFRWLLKGDGLEVTAVAPGGPAARAGLQPGDRIRAIDQEKGTSEMDLRARTWWVERPGTRVRLEVERNKARQALECAILPPAAWNEMDAGTIAAQIRPGMRQPDVERLLGRPLKTLAFESKMVWTYDGFRVVFVDGSVTDVQ